MKFLTDFTYRNLHGFAQFLGDSTALVLVSYSNTIYRHKPHKSMCLSPKRHISGIRVRSQTFTAGAIADDNVQRQLFQRDDAGLREPASSVPPGSVTHTCQRAQPMMHSANTNRRSCDSMGEFLNPRVTTFAGGGGRVRGGLVTLRALSFTLFTGPRSVPPLFSLPSLFSHFPSFPLPLPLEVGPLNTARRRGERCKLLQRSLGRSPSGNRIWCILLDFSFKI